jgi:hypothetical protein
MYVSVIDYVCELVLKKTVWLRYLHRHTSHVVLQNVYSTTVNVQNTFHKSVYVWAHFIHFILIKN